MDKPLSTKRIRLIIYLLSLLISIIAMIISIIAIVEVKTSEPEIVEKTVYVSETTTVPESITEEETAIVETTVESTTKEETTAEPTKPATTAAKSSDYSISEDDIRLIARMALAEAEGESEYGKRLVIDTILNRVGSSKFPNTVNGVIYQSGQFSPVTNGRLDRCPVRNDVYDLVLEELESRTNSEVVYFNGGGYPSYGTPMFQEGSHYFSK